MGDNCLYTNWGTDVLDAPAKVGCGIVGYWDTDLPLLTREGQPSMILTLLLDKSGEVAFVI